MTFRASRLAFVVALAGTAACGSTPTAGAPDGPPDGAPGTNDGGAGEDAADSGSTPIGPGADAGSNDLDAGLPVVPLNGPLPSGRYSIQSVASTHCLDVAGADDGALVVQRPCVAGPSQTFDILPVTSKHYRIIDVSSARGLDIKDNSMASGGAVQQWTFTGGANQEFAIEPQGNRTYVVRARSSALPLDSVDGSAVAQKTVSGDPAQRWTFTPIAAPTPGFAQVSGIGIVDGYGYPLLLRGVSTANWLEPEGYMWELSGDRGDRPRRIEARVAEVLGDAPAAKFWSAFRDAYITEDDIAKIADLGFNSIRLPMNARLLLPEGQSAFDETEMKRIADAVSWSKKHGIYVILDMHCAPGGQTGANIDDDPNDTPDLYTDPKNQDRLVVLWTELARRFATETAVLGYDLLNEPIAPQHSQYNGQLWPIYKRTGAAIRAVDAHHLLIVEGAQWANNWSSLDAPFDAQLVYSFHKYWNNNDQGAIQTYLDARTQWQRPVWVGESGENDNGWYAASFSLLEKNDIGWAFWPWKKLAGGNGPYDIATPSGWDAFQNYVSDASKKPSTSAAQATFDDLLAKIPLNKSTYNDPVICALMPCN